MKAQIALKVIAQERRRQGITQNEVANKLGITSQMYSNLESGRNEITLSRFLEIAEYLNINISLAVPLHDGDTEPVEIEKKKRRAKRGIVRKNTTSGTSGIDWNKIKRAEKLVRELDYIDERDEWIQEKVRLLLEDSGGQGVEEVAKALLSPKDFKKWMGLYVNGWDMDEERALVKVLAEAGEEYIEQLMRGVTR